MVMYTGPLQHRKKTAAKAELWGCSLPLLSGVYLTLTYIQHSVSKDRKKELTTEQQETTDGEAEREMDDGFHKLPLELHIKCKKIKKLVATYSQLKRTFPTSNP